MSSFYFLYDTAGNISTSGFTPDDTFPEGAIVCTEDQAKNPMLYVIKNKKIMDNHNIIAPTILTPQEKLPQAGLSVDELKSLLGI